MSRSQNDCVQLLCVTYTGTAKLKTIALLHGKGHTRVGE